MRPHLRCAHARDHRLRAQEHRLQVHRDGRSRNRPRSACRRVRTSPMPALFTSTSTGPSARSTSAIIRATSAAWDTSARTATALPPVVANRLHDALRRRALLKVVYSNRRARFGQRNRDGPADAPRTAGHQGHAFAQIGHSPLPKS